MTRLHLLTFRIRQIFTSSGRQAFNMQRRTVHIYEPQWRPGQSMVAPEFLPLQLPDNRHADWREFRIFVDFWRRGGHKASDMTGIFSPKFQLKSGMSGASFVSFAQEQLGTDVCLINVFPGIPVYAYNVWMQGEGSHPGLLERAQALVDAAGLGWDLAATPRHDRSNTCFGNFWVATPRFWDDYVGGVLDPIASYLDDHPQSEVTRSVLEPAPYLVQAPYLPFIAERLFSTYLSLHPELVVASTDIAPEASAAVLTEFRGAVLEHLKDRVAAADAAHHFPAELRQELALFSRLMGLHHNLYYSVVPHPHLGDAPGQAKSSAT
jgi:hypothetical protein